MPQPLPRELALDVSPDGSLWVNGVELPWAYTKAKPVLEDVNGALVPGVRVTILGASLGVTSVHSAAAEVEGG